MNDINTMDYENIKNSPSLLNYDKFKERINDINDIQFDKEMNYNIKKFDVLVSMKVVSGITYGVCSIEFSIFEEIMLNLKKNGFDIENDVIKKYGEFFYKYGKFIRVGEDFLEFVVKNTHFPNYVPVYKNSLELEREEISYTRDYGDDEGNKQYNFNRR